MRLGQLVTCASYRNAGLLAKEAACVDVYSDGRLILGLGAGWFHQEYHAYGYEYPSDRVRLAVLEETLQVVRSLSDRGDDHLQRRASRLRRGIRRSKPVQQPPPLLVGGGGERMTRASPPGGPT